MVYLPNILLYIEFLWSQTTISDFHGLKYQWTAARIWEVKPACVCPNVKEFKTCLFLFDWRVDMCGGKKKCVASSQVHMAKTPSEFWHLYYPKEDRGSCLEWPPLLLFRDFHSPSCVFVHSLFSCSYSLLHISSCKYSEYCVLVLVQIKSLLSLHFSLHLFIIFFFSSLGSIVMDQGKT